MNEFHDGMLLFEISDKKVWNKLSNDTISLNNFYEQHKNNWLSRRGIVTKIYTLTSAGRRKFTVGVIRKICR